MELNVIICHGFASLALREAWLREALPENRCLFQTSVFWKKHFLDLQNCVKLELGVGDNDLEINQVSTDTCYCTGFPNHVVLLPSQRLLVLQQKQLISDNASIPLLVQNALKEGGGGDDYNKVVEELKMIRAKLNEI